MLYIFKSDKNVPKSHYGLHLRFRPTNVTSRLLFVCEWKWEMWRMHNCAWTTCPACWIQFWNLYAISAISVAIVSRKNKTHRLPWWLFFYKRSQLNAKDICNIKYVILYYHLFLYYYYTNIFVSNKKKNLREKSLDIRYFQNYLTNNL